MAKEKTDEQIFRKFGLLGRENKTLRALVSSQRRVNGRLYKSIELILEALPQPPKTKSKNRGPLTVNFAKLKKADDFNEKVPGEGVGCKTPGGG